MPNFTWDIDPIAVAIPKDPLLIVLGIVAALMVVGGLVRKQSDVTLFGVFMGILLAVATNFLPDPIGIRYYSLLFVGVFLGGYALLNWQIRRGGGPEEAAGDFIVYGVLGVLVGSRLGHVLFYDLDKAIADPIWVFKIWTGGLASHGAVLGLIVAMFLFTRARRVPFFDGADRFAFSAALGATLVRLGNFFNSEIVGRKTQGDWGVRFPRYDTDMIEAPLRYPTQLFEFGMGLAILGLLYLADRSFGKEKRPRGALIALFFCLYFTARFIVEFFKEYQTLNEADSALTMGQYLSLPGIAVGLVGLYLAFQKHLPAGWTAEARGQVIANASEATDAAAAPGKLYDADVDAELDGDDDAPDSAAKG